MTHKSKLARNEEAAIKSIVKGTMSKNKYHIVVTITKEYDLEFKDEDPDSIARFVRLAARYSPNEEDDMEVDIWRVS